MKTELIPSEKMLPMRTAFTSFIGTDPEFAVVDGKGEAVAACHFFKEKRFLHRNHTMRGTHSFRLVPDGTGVEFQNNGGYSCRVYLMDEIADALQYLQEQGLNVSEAPAIKLREEDKHGDAMRSGCAAENYVNLTDTTELASSDWRTFAGHLHLCTKNPDMQDLGGVMALVKCCDITLGILSTLTSPYPELESVRRQHYGGAGAFRWKKINETFNRVEYRTPSSAIFYHPAVFHINAGLAKQLATITTDVAKVILKVYEKYPVDEWINNFDNSDAMREQMLLAFREAYGCFFNTEILWGERIAHPSSVVEDSVIAERILESFTWGKRYKKHYTPSMHTLVEFLMQGGLLSKNPHNSTIFERWNCEGERGIHGMGLETERTVTHSELVNNYAYLEFTERMNHERKLQTA